MLFLLFRGAGGRHRTLCGHAHFGAALSRHAHPASPSHAVSACPFPPTASDQSLTPLPPGSPAGVRSSCESPAPPRPPWIRAHTPDLLTGPRRFPIPRESTVSHSGDRRSPGYSADAPQRTSEARACDTSRPRYDGAWRPGEGRFGSCRCGCVCSRLPRLFTRCLKPKGTKPAVSFP